MKFVTAHPKIKEIVAQSYFTSLDHVENQLSMGAQLITCSTFLEAAIKEFGGKVVEPLMQFFNEYIGTNPNVGTEGGILTMKLEISTFLQDGSRDGIMLKIHESGDDLGNPVLWFDVYQLVGVFGVTTERLIKSIKL